MIAIPIQINKDEYDLILVLEDINIERVKKYDPIVVENGKFDRLTDGLKLRELVILYGNDEEMRLLASSTGGEDSKRVLRSLMRGYEDRPDLGDNTGSYQRVGRN